MRLVLFALLILTTPALAQSAAERGRAIADKADAADRGWGDAQASLSMQITTRSGSTATRQLAFRSREGRSGGDGAQSLVTFVAPRDVQDTALLTHAKAQGADDQWIFLPALKRTTRISGATKASPFMGSEFAYEDFIATDVGRFSYSFVREDACGPLRCAVIERVPGYAGSGYAKQIVWIDTQAWRIQRIDYTSQRGQFVKTLTASGWKLHDGKYWRAQELLMVNHLTGARTLLSWGPFRFGAGLPAQGFTSTSLGR
jgi:outer membrane lipoprotein-sorting protein